MHENKEGLAISFWTSLAGLAVAGLSPLAIFMCRGNDFVLLPIFIAAPIFFGLITYPFISELFHKLPIIIRKLKTK